MTKSTYYLVLLLVFLAASVSGALSVRAQAVDYSQTTVYGTSASGPTMTTTSGPAVATAATASGGSEFTVMPILYNSSGVAMNTGTGSLPAGYYFTAPSGGMQVYYYGNGTFYNPTTGLYGGSVSNPSGRAGPISIAIAQVPTTPGVPNTGVGGNSAILWAELIVAVGLVIVGMTYLARRPA